MDYVFLIARCALGGYLAWQGAPRLDPYGRNDALAYAQRRRVPLPLLTVPVSGFLLVCAGASIITGAFAAAGVALAVGCLSVTSLSMHAWWRSGVASERAAQRRAFTRDVLLIAASVATLLVDRPWPLAAIA